MECQDPLGVLFAQEHNRIWFGHFPGRSFASKLGSRVGLGLTKLGNQGKPSRYGNGLDPKILTVLGFIIMISVDESTLNPKSQDSRVFSGAGRAQDLEDRDVIVLTIIRRFRSLGPSGLGP